MGPAPTAQTTVQSNKKNADWGDEELTVALPMAIDNTATKVVVSVWDKDEGNDADDLIAQSEHTLVVDNDGCVDGHYNDMQCAGQGKFDGQAVRTTFMGSTTPASMRFSYVSVAAL